MDLNEIKKKAFNKARSFLPGNDPNKSEEENLKNMLGDGLARRAADSITKRKKELDKITEY